MVVVKPETLHRGIPRCVEVTGGEIRFVVVPTWAGRLSLLDFGQGNVLFNNPKVDGKRLSMGQSWGVWDGNATDVVLGTGEGSLNQFSGIWLHPWSIIEQLNDGIRIAGGYNSQAGLSAERIYQLDKKRQTLQYTYRITAEKTGNEPWTVRERCVFPGDATVFAPLDQSDPKANRKHASENKTSKLTSTNIIEDMLVLQCNPAGGISLAATLREGWIAVLQGRSVMLMQFKIIPNGSYLHEDGVHAFFWLAPNYIEVEPLSPTVSLPSKQSLSFKQIWSHRLVPNEIDSADITAVGQWLRAAEPSFAWPKWADSELGEFWATPKPDSIETAFSPGLVYKDDFEDDL